MVLGKLAVHPRRRRVLSGPSAHRARSSRQIGRRHRGRIHFRESESSAVGCADVDADTDADSDSDSDSDGDSDADADGQHTDCDRYEPVEIVVTSAVEYDNPYVDVSLTASVTPPAGSGEAPYRIPGFWDGGSTWRVRFAPREAGTYGVTLECSNPSDTGLHGRTFSFTTSAAGGISRRPRGTST